MAYKCGILAILIISFIRSNVLPNNETDNEILPYNTIFVIKSNAKCTCVSFRIQYPQLFV